MKTETEIQKAYLGSYQERMGLYEKDKINNIRIKMIEERLRHLGGKCNTYESNEIDGLLESLHVEYETLRFAHGINLEF